MIHELNFDLIDDNGRSFYVGFYSEGPKENTLMAIIYEALPIDTVSLPVVDAELYGNICKSMETTALDYWADPTPKQSYQILNEQMSLISKALGL